MDAVDLFAALLAQRGRVLANEYSSLPAYTQLINAGFVEETGVVHSIVCDECDEAHEAAIVYEDSQYGFYCPDLGFMPKDRAELVAAHPNIGALVTQIADHLNCKRRKSTPLANETWRIGSIDTPAAEVVLYFRPTMQDAYDLTDFEAALASAARASFGILLTSIGTLRLPSYTTVLLQDVLSIDAGDLAIVADLATIAGVPEIRAGGRPSEYKKALNELIAVRESQGQALKGRNEEAKALQAHFMAQFPHIKCPSLPTVRRYVSDARSGS